MKNYFKILAAFLLVMSFMSCRETETGFTYDGESLLHFPDKIANAQTVTLGDPDKDITIAYGTMSPVAGEHQVTLVVDPTSTAVAGVHYEIVKGTDQLSSGEIEGNFIVRLLTAGLTPAAKKLVLKLSSPTLGTSTVKNTYTLDMNKVCPSNLAGTYQFSTVNFGQGSSTIPGPTTGTVSFTQSAVGVYNISDASFGAYLAMYGPADPGAYNVKLTDACGKLAFSGANQYGDTHTISNVVVNGPNLTFNWVTSYNEFGKTTLTRTDGTNWPSTLN